MNDPILVLDNGASTIKAGMAESDEPRIILNAVVRSPGDKMNYIGHEFEHCKDYASLHYRLPFEKGYLVDWDAQKAIWDGIFSDQVFGINTAGTSLLITEPYFNLPNIQEVYDQLVFEEYDFKSYHRCAPASLIPHGTLFSVPGLPPAECTLVIDSGFSFTHVVPIMNGKIIWNAVKRLDIGGKLLTNHLKELISFRQWNMMDETYIMNDVKEACCYVSTNFEEDLETCRADPTSNSIVREYILPDLSVNRKGRVRGREDIVADSDQILMMNNERFSVPEIIFRPDNIAMDQCGLADTIAVSISLLPEDLRGMFWANIGLIGGNTKFPGFRRRLQAELRSRAPVDIEVVIYDCDEPTTEAYRSALALVRSPQFTQQTVSREEYAESGSNASRRKFADWKASGQSGQDAANKGIRDTTSKEKSGKGARVDERMPQTAVKKLSRTRSKVVNTTNNTPTTSRRRG